ncbi:MAG: 2-oxoglutarate dehydrogenase, E2 component, dihydrolipoamide succinyltransferase [Acidobacteria bacterium]|nr:MAG: 2-oxoglutarate dehydrogenase, E2 component, dihydrolipoamide succinyltransferase [Acidobacteriota bacterium]
MPTDVVMPQMGESIAEGTVVRWIKKIGDKVDRDEPLFEISTDKVDAEIPSPIAGVLTEIRVKEGETVSVNSVVAVIGQTGEAAATPAAQPRPAVGKPTPDKEEQHDARPRLDPSAAGGRNAAKGNEDALHQRSSPLVRKIAKDHQVDLSQIHGTGIAGRVTKNDILGYLGADGVKPAERLEPAAFGVSGQVVPMSVMRRKIAEHMITSRRTSAHVHSVFEVGFSRVAQIRDQRKAEFERAGAKLTYLSFIIKAVTDALRTMPIVNASIDGDNIVYHSDVNVGIAVALDWGLIVPVIKTADERNLLGLSRAVADLANRARNKQLKPDEVTGGTFTITNPGVFGALFGMPIINQPQVAILGVGHVEKRPIVIEDDAIAIRPMAYLTLGYDHRIIDGAVADQFMSRVKRTLENWDPATV